MAILLKLKRKTTADNGNHPTIIQSSHGDLVKILQFSPEKSNFRYVPRHSVNEKRNHVATAKLSFEKRMMQQSTRRAAQNVASYATSKPLPSSTICAGNLVEPRRTVSILLSVSRIL